MINWIKYAFVSAMITLTRYMPGPTGVLAPTEQGEIEPQKEMDDWDRWLRHDDVTPDEEAMLFSNDPMQIMMAHEQILARQQEAQAILEDKDALKDMFQEGYLKNADLNRPQTPMDQREGWEDDEDMPESFIGVNQETGDLEEINFDELPEWRQ